jgi:DNA-binding MarR family transcriptional regulator
MITIKGLTEFENKVLDYICQELSTWREDEPGYSCIDGSDVTRDLQLKPRSTSGVIGSLCKKGYLVSEEGDFKDILYIVWEKIPDDFGRVETDSKIC